MIETDYAGTGIYDLRTEAGKKARLTGQRLNQRNKWNRQECLDFLVLDTMPERFTPVVIDNQLPMFDSTPETIPVETSVESDEIPFDDSEPIQFAPVNPYLPVTPKTANAVNPPLPVLKPNKNHNGMLPNGRTAKATPDFSKWFGRVHPSDVSYPAWKYLSKTSTDVANICKAKHDHAAHCGKKDASGFPWFEFSFKEAVNTFKISRPTFDKSIKQLVAVGFLKYRLIGDVPQCGNFVNGRGTPAQFQLSNVWETWTPGMDEVLNPAARKKGKESDKKQNPSKPVFTSTRKPTFTSKAE